jgi:cob(I)alamin adenosyltransferase
MMTEFFTRTGDDGYTGLLGEGRVPKYHPRPETVGTIDEATAALGIARSACMDDQTPALIMAAQRDLYHIMAEISATPENASRFRAIDQAKIDWLEAQIERLGTLVEVPKEFILPGDSPSGAMLSLARAIIRRAERQVAQLLHEQIIENPYLLQYLNRLSSLCFVLELLENQAFGHSKPTLAKIVADNDLN